MPGGGGTHGRERPGGGQCISDGTLAEVSRRSIARIANATNRGFAAAVNQGFAATKSKYVLLLNPDAEISGGLDQLREACELPHAAAAGGRLVDSDGKPQAGFMVRQLPTPLVLTLEVLLLNRLWPNNPVNRRYRSLELNYDIQMPVEQPAGAFLMVARRAVWEELGGFDEGFFPLWFEDVDFCRRAINRGHQLYVRSGGGCTTSRRVFNFSSNSRETPRLLVWRWMKSDSGATKMDRIKLKIPHVGRHLAEVPGRGVCPYAVNPAVGRIVAGAVAGDGSANRCRAA